MIIWRVWLISWFSNAYPLPRLKDHQARLHLSVFEWNCPFQTPQLTFWNLPQRMRCSNKCRAFSCPFPAKCSHWTSYKSPVRLGAHPSRACCSRAIPDCTWVSGCDKLIQYGPESPLTPAYHSWRSHTRLCARRVEPIALQCSWGRHPRSKLVDDFADCLSFVCFCRAEAS